MNADFPWQWLKDQLSAAAADGIYMGTSSWKYPGWLGSVYDEQRYLYRGKVAESRFDKQCLSEYAALFPTVCVDAAYYQFPSADRLLALASQVPPDFTFSFKVTADITLSRFPGLPRFGNRAGQANPDFLNADLFISAFLGPCSAIRSQTALVILEFSTFHREDFARGRDFMDRLEPFLAQLLPGWDYGIEIRNRHFLHPDYFALLSHYGITHVFNSWSAMPSVTDQWSLQGSVTRPDRVGARLLLKPGRKYQEAVESFQPYQDIREPLPELRETVAGIIRQRRSPGTGRKTWLYVNNRLEGNAPRTIAAVLAMAAGLQQPMP